MYCTCLYSRFYFTLYASIFIFVIISLLKIVSLFHVSLSIDVPVHVYMYVLIAMCIQSEFPNTDDQSMIITTTLHCECLAELLDHG